jgi:hypothetical protein
MEQMSPIPVVPSAHKDVQVVSKVVMLRDRMHMIVDHLNYIEKLLCA